MCIRDRDRGTTVVLVIEVVGAANIKKLYPESTLIFIMPPSMDELRARLRGRGTESEEAIAGRLKRAEEELPYEMCIRDRGCCC